MTTYSEWRKEVSEIRCSCGSKASVQRAIIGTVGGQKAKWAGCPNCQGRAVGYPWIYRSKA